MQDAAEDVASQVVRAGKKPSTRAERHAVVVQSTRDLLVRIRQQVRPDQQRGGQGRDDEQCREDAASEHQSIPESLGPHTTPA